MKEKSRYVSIIALVIFIALVLYNADEHIYAVLPISVAMLILLGRYLLLRRRSLSGLQMLYFAVNYNETLSFHNLQLEISWKEEEKVRI